MADDPTKLTEQVAHIGDVVKYWLDELAAQNPDIAGTGHTITIFGPDDEGADSAPPSVQWAPTSESFGPPSRLGKNGAPGPLFVRGIPIAFALFGGLPPEDSYTVAEAPYIGPKVTEVMMSKLVNIIHRTVSSQSYQVDSVNWFAPGRTCIGSACELVVSIRLPLIREDNPTVKITGATAHAEIVHE